MIIIDADFVNLAIQEVYNLYPQYSNREFDIAKFLLLLFQYYFKMILKDRIIRFQ